MSKNEFHQKLQANSLLITIIKIMTDHCNTLIMNKDWGNYRQYIVIFIWWFWSSFFSIGWFISWFFYPVHAKLHIGCFHKICCSCQPSESVRAFMVSSSVRDSIEAKNQVNHTFSRHNTWHWYKLWLFYEDGRFSMKLFV